MRVIITSYSGPKFRHLEDLRGKKALNSVIWWSIEGSGLKFQRSGSTTDVDGGQGKSPNLPGPISSSTKGGNICVIYRGQAWKEGLQLSLVTVLVSSL